MMAVVGWLASVYNPLNHSTNKIQTIARFEQFRLASGLAEENEVKQLCTLMYYFGEDAAPGCTVINKHQGKGKGGV